jgi:hypothetical protein
VTQLEIVDDERGLDRPVDVEGRSQLFDDDPDGSPRSGDEVDVGFVDAGRFLSESKPRIVRMRHVLGGVVPTELIIGAAVGRPEEEGLEVGCLWLDAKGDTDESSSELGGTSTRKGGDGGLDRSVPEFGSWQDRQCLDIALSLISLKESDSAATAVADKPRIDMPKLELTGRWEMDRALVSRGHAGSIRPLCPIPPYTRGKRALP